MCYSNLLSLFILRYFFEIDDIKKKNPKVDKKTKGSLFFSFSHFSIVEKEVRHQKISNDAHAFLKISRTSMGNRFARSFNWPADTFVRSLV